MAFPISTELTGLSALCCCKYWSQRRRKWACNCSWKLSSLAYLGDIFWFSRHGQGLWTHIVMLFPTALCRSATWPWHVHSYFSAGMWQPAPGSPGFPGFPQLECLRLAFAGWHRPIWEESPKALTSSLAGTSLLSHPLGRGDRKAHLLPPGLPVSRRETAAQLPGILWPLYELSLREGLWREEVGHIHIKYQRWKIIECSWE